jgi:hypothetical protein
MASAPDPFLVFVEHAERPRNLDQPATAEVLLDDGMGRGVDQQVAVVAVGAAVDSHFALIERERPVDALDELGSG